MIPRRKFLSLSLGAAAGAVLAPRNLFCWGAVVGAAPTHQMIQNMALQILAKDPVRDFSPFPNHDHLESQDYVSPGGGTGPDKEGASAYSWHYFNPFTQKGKGPEAVYQHYRQFITQCRLAENARETARLGAWTAHFLADMHVPYHVVGIPAQEAFDRLSRRDFILSGDECGPSYLYRLLDPPEGWGGYRDFYNAIDYFCWKHPKDLNGKIGTVDWFDPWYYNGVGSNTIPVGFKDMVTGSHASWEFQLAITQSESTIREHLNKLLRENFYNPLWKNAKVVLGNESYLNYQEAISNQAKEFTAECAYMTRNDIRLIFDNPAVGISRAIRSVLTMYRGSMTAIVIQPFVKPVGLGKQKLICRVINRHPYENLMNIDARCTISAPGRRKGANKHISQYLGPNQETQFEWDLSLAAGKSLDALFEVSGFYQSTPDIGYRAMEIRVEGTYTHEDQPIEEEPSISPILNAWSGKWSVREEHISGIHKGKIYESSFTIEITGNQATLILPPKNHRYPMTITQGGNCLEAELLSGKNRGFVEICMNNDRNSYQGTLSYISPTKMSAIITGSRFR